MRRTVAWSLWTTAIALSVAGAALLLFTLDAPVPDQWGFRGYWDLAAPLIATPGLLIALRRPRDPIR